MYSQGYTVMLFFLSFFVRNFCRGKIAFTRILDVRIEDRVQDLDLKAMPTVEKCISGETGVNRDKRKCVFIIICVRKAKTKSVLH